MESTVPQQSQSFNQAIGYAGSVVATVSAWSISEWASAIGVVMAVVVFVSGQVRARRAEARQQEEHDAIMRVRLLEEEELLARKEGRERKKEAATCG